uniref:NADH-ubiquinone oxidoreductase chain 6 n=1 Tax=Graphosoma rubrolineatum TaxID=295705 RepID=A0A1P8D004_GRARU|nr:NADH dehydrogenase subunit 6 [Graphosoma rubrolineatum]API85477.1 NADH dehydrogenase subunit 6 [Graphosoma rubrolineatum]
MLLSFMIAISFILMTLNHPLSMGLILIIQTLIVSSIIGYMMTSFLFSYIIIIIMLSGALVLFIYMASVASNEKFESPIKNSIIVIFVLFMMTYYLNSINFKYFNFNKPTANEYVSLIKIFNTMTSNLTLLMIIYLLITMIVVSNIAKTNKGPLRMKI